MHQTFSQRSVGVTSEADTRKSVATVDYLVNNSFQNIFFCVQQKKEVCTGLEQLEGEYDRIFSFGLIILLKA